MLDDQVVVIQPLIPYAISLELYRAPGNKGSMDIVRQTFWTYIISLWAITFFRYLVTWFRGMGLRPGLPPWCS